jgi:hypothetical protein
VKQVLDVLRVQLVGSRIRVGIPLVALAIVLVVVVAVLAALGPVGPLDGVRSGVLGTFYLTVCAVHMQTTAQTFRLALGLGVTRRAFWAATAALAVLEAAGYGALLVLLRLVERVTGGWGLQVGILRLDGLDGRGAPLAALGYAGPVLALVAVGAFVGAVAARWEIVGVYWLVLGALVLGGLGALLIAAVDGWAGLVEWVVDQSPLALAVTYPLVLAVVLAGGGWLVLRRATA